MKLRSIAVDFQAAFYRWWLAVGPAMLAGAVFAAYVLYRVHHHHG